LQVELAQLKYRLPRLTGKGIVLSRLGGGIGTRGPGETKLEVDRRRIKQRIVEIEKEIAKIRRHRTLHRLGRAKMSYQTVALIGYTNAGKSTLLNRLTGANVLAEDKLFATLDPTTRRVTLPGGKEVLLTDTVGFINKLPHELIAAFRATLEEVLYANMLIHVIDISHPRREEQASTVLKVLQELGVEEKPMITALNKADLLGETAVPGRLAREGDCFLISALTGSGTEDLLAAIERKIAHIGREIELFVPYKASGVLSQLFREGKISSTIYSEDGIMVKAFIPESLALKYIGFAGSHSKDEEL